MHIYSNTFKPLIFTFILLFLFSLVGCTAKETDKVKFNLYFLEEQNNKIVSEIREIEIPNNALPAKIAVQELLKGPNKEGLKSAIPKNTELLDIKVQNELVKVNFSKEFFELNDISSKNLAIISVVNTLTDLPDIDKVSIMLEGKDLLSSDGKPYGPLTRKSLNKIDKKKPKKQQTSNIDVIVYFSDEEAMYLVPETRKIEVKESDKIYLEKMIVEELLKGPKIETHFDTIPKDTKLLSIKVDDKTAYVDFSKEFKENHPGGSTGEIMTVYSVVNSLTELDSIDKVVFLVEGQKEKTLAGHLIFDEPFGRDETLIKK